MKPVYAPIPKYTIKAKTVPEIMIIGVSVISLEVK